MFHLLPTSGGKEKMNISIKKVGPSARAKDAPIRQALRLDYAPLLEALEVGGDGLSLEIPKGMDVTRFRSLVQAVSNKAGYTIATEVVYRRDKKGKLVLDDAKNKIPVALLAHKTGEVSAADAESPPSKAAGKKDDPFESDEQEGDEGEDDDEEDD